MVMIRQRVPEALWVRFCALVTMQRKTRTDAVAEALRRYVEEAKSERKD